MSCTSRIYLQTDKSMPRRVFEILIAFGLLACCVPLYGILYIWKKSQNKKLFFSQCRIGLHERPFILHKLQTMPDHVPEVATHQLEPLELSKLDQLLRRSKFDETPQLLNIIKGEMSFVGPRPCLPNQHALIEERKKSKIFHVKPGITGLAQINHIDMSNIFKITQKDREYIERKSIYLDVKIFFKTFTKIKW